MCPRTKAEESDEVTPRGRLKWGTGRELIAESCVNVMSAEGIDKVTMRRVAIEADVSVGLVTHHFGDRETLIVESLRWLFEGKARTPTVGSSTIDDFGARLPAQVQENLAQTSFEFELTTMTTRFQELLPVAVEVMDTYVDGLADGLLAMGLPKDNDIADFINVVICGICFNQLRHRDPARSERSLVLLRKLLTVLAVEQAA